MGLAIHSLFSANVQRRGANRLLDQPMVWCAPAKRRVVGKERERAGSSHKSVKDPFCLSEVWPTHGQGEKKKEGGIRGALALRIEF